MRAPRRRFALAALELRGRTPRFLPAEEVRAALARDGLREWVYEREAQRLSRALRFPDFACAMAFVNSFADFQRRAEQYCKVANRAESVEVDLAAFSTWGVSDVHLRLARVVELLAAKCARAGLDPRAVLAVSAEELAAADER